MNIKFIIAFYLGFSFISAYAQTVDTPSPAPQTMNDPFSPQAMDASLTEQTEPFYFGGGFQFMALTADLPETTDNPVPRIDETAIGYSLYVGGDINSIFKWHVAAGASGFDMDIDDSEGGHDFDEDDLATGMMSLQAAIIIAPQKLLGTENFRPHIKYGADYSEISVSSETYEDGRSACDLPNAFGCYTLAELSETNPLIGIGFSYIREDFFVRFDYESVAGDAFEKEGLIMSAGIRF